MPTTPGQWRCGICGAPIEGDAALIMRIQRHLQTTHDWPDVSDRWRLARNAVWIETTDAPAYETTALMPWPSPTLPNPNVRTGKSR